MKPLTKELLKTATLFIGIVLLSFLSIAAISTITDNPCRACACDGCSCQSCGCGSCTCEEDLGKSEGIDTVKINPPPHG